MKRQLRLVAAIVLWQLATSLGATEWQAQLAALEEAARQSGPKAQTELAMKYENSEGVPKDLQAANRLYCFAAKQGYADAQFKLGWMYANGRGVPRDDGIAAALFKMAADQGHEYATKLLSYFPQQSGTQMPLCLLPDPPEPVRVVLQSALVDDAAARDAGSEIEQLVRRLAPQYAVDSELALAVIFVESAFNPAAISPKHAQGLMQLIPETAARFGVKEVFDPVENIKGGLAYLRWLLAFFKGDVRLVVAAYNAGERAVEKYRGVPPYAETRNYVRKVTGIYKRTNHPYESQVIESSPIMAGIKRTRG